MTTHRPILNTVACAALLACGAAQSAVTATGSFGTSPLPLPIGPGDTVAPTSAAYIGAPGVGTLTVDGASFLQLARLSFATGGTGNGIGLISGAGTRVELVGDGFSNAQVQRLTVGDWGQAQLTVQQGAQLDTAGNQTPCLLAFHYCDSFVGSAAGDTAQLNLDGSGTRVRTGQNLFVAQPGLAVPALDGYTYGTPGGTTRGTVNITGGAELVTDRAQIGPRHWSTAATGREKNIAEVNVSGAGSRWLVVGGARVDNATGVVSEGGANILTGQDRNSWATINVTGGGLIEVQGQDSVYNSIGLSGGGGRSDMLVSGAGSRVTFASLSGVVQVGRSLGSAQLDVRDGGLLEKVFYLSVGRDGSFGTLNVDGAGSVVRVDSVATAAANVSTGSAVMDIGRGGGTGVVNVSNGGRLEVLSTTATTNGMSLSLGRDAASSGTLNIGSGGTVFLSAASVAPGTAGEAWNPFVRIGRDGNGTLNISGGGQLVLEGNAVSTVNHTRRTSLFIGGSGDTSPGGRALATVGGPGSEIRVSGSDAYIGIGHGPQASGNLLVSNQGRLAATILGVGNFGGTGVLKLDNARVDLSGQYTGSGEFGAVLLVGAQTGAVGNVQLSNGSLVRIENLAGSSGGFSLGGSRTLSGGDGSLSLSGGSRIEVLLPDGVGGGTVGRTGSGLLRLSGGSSVDVGTSNFTVAPFQGADGTVVATGGSTITAGWVGVGRRLDAATGASFDGGTGTLVLNGATLFAQDVVIGTNGFLGGSAGSIVVSGSVTNHGIFAPGSSPGTFSIHGSFVAGGSSRLVLEVQDDGSGGFLTDLVQFNGSADLGAMAVEFRFLGATDPTEFLASGRFDVDTFLQQADGQGGFQGLQASAFATVAFSASAEAYVIEDFSYSVAAGPVFTAAPVPEPAPWVLLAAGLVGLALRRRIGSV
jgi:hypothetical protein